MRCVIAALLCVSSFAQEITVHHLVLPLGGSGVIEFKGGETRVLGSTVVTNALGSEGCKALHTELLVDIPNYYKGELRLPFGGDNASLFLGCSSPRSTQLKLTTPSCPVNLTISVTSWILNMESFDLLTSDAIEVNNEGSAIHTDIPLPYFYILQGSFWIHSLGNCELPLNCEGALVPDRNRTENLRFHADSNHTNTNFVGKLFHPTPQGNTLSSYIKILDQNCTAEIYVFVHTKSMQMNATDAPKTATPWTDMPLSK